MARKKTILTLTIAFLLLSIITAHSPASVSGQTTSAHLVYLPLISNPPEPPIWIGPYGGYIIAIAVAPSQPSMVYAGTWGSGIYKSTDGGATWTRNSQGLSHPYINSMAVDPENAQVAYAGTYTGKVYKTLDGGENWFQSSTNIQDQAIVYSIVIDPQDTENIYIGTRGISNDGGPPWNGVLYRSTDAGRSWVPKLTNIGGSAQEDWVYSVTLHPKYPNQIYGATHEHGIYRSFDYGKNWEAVNDGITSMTTRGIVVNPNSAETSPILYTGVWKWQGVFRSNNGGDNWFPVDNGSKDTRIYSMSINPKASYIVYASTFSGGVLKTNDGGDSWEIVGLNDYEIPITAVDLQNPNILYAGTNGNGLYKSTNAGESWQTSQQGLHATKVSVAQISPLNPLQVYVGLENDGVKQSGDGGLNWSSLGIHLGDPVVLDLVIPPNQPQTLFALTELGGLYRCNLQATCWEKININFPLTSRVVLAETHPFWTPPLLAEKPEFLSVTMGTPALSTMQFAHSNPQIAYLGTSGAGVYKSFDEGSTWNPAGLPDQKIVSLVIAESDPNKLYAASDFQVWSSTNGGVNWIDTGLGGVNIYALTLDAAGNLYAGTNNGVYQRTLAGWTYLGLAGSPVTALAAHPIKADWLYAGTSDGLRISRSSGQTWQNGLPELTGVAITAISFDPTDASRLLISTSHQGVLEMHDWK